MVFRTSHVVKFSDLDPYDHMRTAAYPAYFIDHRMDGLRERIGWDLRTLSTLPFMTWVRRMEIDFIRPVVGDQAITITSFVRSFEGADALVECTMADAAGKALSRCRMTVTCVDRGTNRGTPWPADAEALFFEDGA